MKRVGLFRRLIGCVFSATVVLSSTTHHSVVDRVQAATPSGLVPAEAFPGDLENGRKLFERVWLPGADAKNDVDGLGPLFNERSCVACHSLGGIGGGGLNEKNVELLTVVVPVEWQWTQSELQNVLELNLHQVGPGAPQLRDLERRARLIHQDLRNGSMVLHSFGTDPRYAATRERVLGLTPTPEKLRPQATATTMPLLRRAVGSEPVKTVQIGDVTLQVSGRNSTAMFGAGLIDQIPESVLRQLAEDQQRRSSKISGRYVGRFGWRGQIARLDAFVFGACDIELGLTLEDPTTVSAAQAAPAPQAKGAKPANAAKPAKKPTSFDLGVKDTDDLVAFTAALPSPQRRPAKDDVEAAAIAHGEKVFTSVGCAECHTPSIGSVEGLYSDLLVHDMGPFLADPSQPANLTDPKPMKLEKVNETASRMAIQYYCKVKTIVLRDPRKDEPLLLTSLGEKFGERLQEWKTPPLWGLADSAPYLHDGRAATVDAAITWHGGEAVDVTAAYRLLPENDRADLLTFLATLVAPPGLKPTTP